MIAIGVIDTMGLVAAVEALDVCLKTAEVRLVNCEPVKGGIVSLTITGDVAAVSSAVQAGIASAQRLNGYLHHTIIARIDEQTGLLFEQRGTPERPTPEPENETQSAAAIAAQANTVAHAAVSSEPELQPESQPDPLASILAISPTQPAVAKKPLAPAKFVPVAKAPAPAEAKPAPKKTTVKKPRKPKKEK
jgi:microcompartment protein CcmL/EutN